VERVWNETEIRGAYIIGGGNRAFVAGADIADLKSSVFEGGKRYAERGHALMDRIEQCPSPIVAAVNGLALGGGMELAMACHFRLASDNARFGLPEIKLGILAGFGGTQRSIRMIGQGRATELMLTGEMMGAKEAYERGLVNHMVPVEELIPKTRSILERISGMSPIATAQILRCSNAYFDGDGAKEEIEAFDVCCMSADSQEGMAAFLEKRKAEFKGE